MDQTHPSGGAVLGDVGEPDPVGRFGGELALDQVVVGGRVRLEVAVLALVADPAQPGGPHTVVGARSQRD